MNCLTVLDIFSLSDLRHLILYCLGIYKNLLYKKLENRAFLSYYIKQGHKVHYYIPTI
nr:MAG TPA: hypothetical protein [Caudoviricetes sp.]